jgi:hypothetical protein
MRAGAKLWAPMRIPADSLIPAEKLSGYLLLPRSWDDKAKVLAQAGFERGNPDALLGALRDLAAATDAAPDGVNEYGNFSGLTATWWDRTAASLR